MNAHASLGIEILINDMPRIFQALLAAIFLRYLAYTVTDAALVYLWRDTCFSFIAVADSIDKLRMIAGSQQIDRTAAKTATGHPGPEQAPLLPRHFDHDVELAAAHLVILFE